MTSTTTSATTPVFDDAPDSTALADADTPSSDSPSRNSVLSFSSTYAASVFTFNASWRPHSLSPPTFLGEDVQSRQVTDGSGSGSSRSPDAKVDLQEVMDVHCENADEDRLSEASTYAEGQDGPFSDPIAEYLAGYGFYDGLGYDVMPPDEVLEADDGQQYATVYPQTHQHRPICSPSPTAIEHEFPGSNLPKTFVGNGWERAFMQKGVLEALLSVMGIDERLQNDPLGAWEDMCWDVAAPATPVLPSEWEFARVDERADRGIAADITTDAHHDWDQARALSNAGDGIARSSRHGSQAMSDGGVSTPQTARPRPTVASVLEQVDEQEVLDISPTAAPAQISITQEVRSQSPSETIASGPPSDDWLAETGAHAQGRRINRSSRTSRPSSPNLQDSRPSSSTSHSGGYASFAQAMVRQRRPLSTRTPPLRLSMVMRESVPMYGATDRDPLLLGDPPENPPHDPPPYEAGGTTANGQAEITPANTSPEAIPTPAVSPLPAPPSSLPEEEGRPSPHHDPSTPHSSNHSSVYSNRAVVGTRNKASVPMPIPFTNAFNVTGSPATQASIHTNSPSYASHSASPLTQSSTSPRNQNANLSPSSTDSDALRTPTGAWPHAPASASVSGWNPSAPVSASVLSSNYISTLFSSANARDSVAQSPSRSEASRRRTRPLPTAPSGPLAPGITRVVPASWVSTSVPAQLSSPSHVNAVIAHGQGLPVKVSIEVTDQDVHGHLSGSGSDESGFAGYLKSNYGASKDNLSLTSPTSTMSLRTPTKLSPLRRLDNAEGSERKARERSMKDLSVNTSLAVGNGMKRFATRCGTISRKIVNGSVVR